jgi:uncharacterized protein YecE (DUF72 family)
MAKGALHIGTSGWVYPHWRNVFYPAKLPQRSWLEYYAQYFDCTEVNGSFYRLPSKETVIRWQHTVNTRFRFCPKISRFITHAKKLNDPEQAVPRFFDVFNVIAGRSGPVLIQLPPMLAFKEDKVRTFFQYLREHYRSFLFSLEARHATWLEPSAIALLKQYRVGWVIDKSGFRFASGDAVTARHIYLRFHGPDGSYATGYSKKFLSSQAALCRDWRAAGHQVWVFFNNDLQGHAVRDALALKSMTS